MQPRLDLAIWKIRSVETVAFELSCGEDPAILAGAIMTGLVGPAAAGLPTPGGRGDSGRAVVPIETAPDAGGRDRRPGDRPAPVRTTPDPVSAGGVPVVRRHWPVVLPEALLAHGTARPVMTDAGATGPSRAHPESEAARANPAAVAKAASEAYRRNGAAPGLYPTLPRIFRVSV
jgi:hypothetical protein